MIKKPKLLIILPIILISCITIIYALTTVTFTYIGDYYSERANTTDQSLRRGSNMSREALGIILKSSETVTLTNKGEVAVRISFFTQNTNQDYTLTVGANQTVTYTNNLPDSCVPIIESPINQNKAGKTFEIEIKDFETFEKLPIFNGKASKTKYNDGIKFDILNNSNEVYATVTISNSTFKYERIPSISSDGIDYAISIKNNTYQNVTDINKNTNSMTLDIVDFYLFSITQSDFSNKIKFYDLNNNSVNIEPVNNSVGLRYKRTFVYDDSYISRREIKASIYNDDDSEAGYFEVAKGLLTVDLTKSTTNATINIKDSNNVVVKSVKSGEKLENYDIKNGYTLEFKNALVKNFVNNSGAFTSKSYNRYNYNKENFSLSVNDYLLNVTSYNEQSFINEFKNTEYAVFDFDRVLMLVPSKYYNFFANKQYYFYSLLDSSTFFNDYIEYFDKMSGFGVYTPKVVDGKYFFRTKEESTSGFLAFVYNKWIYSYQGAFSAFFTSYWGSMHEIGHGTQIQGMEYYTTEVSVNFGPSTYRSDGTLDGKYYDQNNATYLNDMVTSAVNGGSYANSSQQLLFFTNISNVYSSEIYGYAHGNYYKNVLMENNGYDTTNYYQRAFSDYTGLNLIPYFDLFKLYSNNKAMYKYFNKDYAYPLSALIGDTRAQELYDDINLPYRSALATKDQVDSLNIKNDLTVNLDEKLIGSNLVIYESGYKEVKTVKIDSTNMVIKDLPIGYYFVTTDYNKEKYYADGKFVMHTTFSNSISLAVNYSYETFTLYGRGNWDADFIVFDNYEEDIYWWLNKAQANSNYDSTYIEFTHKRGDEILLKKTFKGNVLYDGAVENGTIHFEEGDIFEVYHAQGASRLVAFGPGKVSLPQYGNKTTMTFMFTGGSLKPIVDGTPNNKSYYDALTNYNNTLYQNNKDIYLVDGIFSYEKSYINKVLLTVDFDKEFTSLEDVYVFIYDLNGNYVTRAKVENGKALLYVNPSKYIVTSNLVTKDVYSKESNKVINATSNKNVTLEVSDYVPTNLIIDITSNSKIATISNSLDKLTIKSTLNNSCTLENCLDDSAQFVNVSVIRGTDSILNITLDVKNSQNINQVISLVDNDLLVITPLMENTNNQSITGYSGYTNNYLDSYSSNTKIEYLFTDGMLVPSSDTTNLAYREDFKQYASTLNDTQNALYNQTGLFNNIKFYNMELMKKENILPTFIGIEDIQSNYYINNIFNPFDNVTSLDSNGLAIEYTVSYVNPKGQEVTLNKGDTVLLNNIGIYTFKYYAVDKYDNSNSVYKTITVSNYKIPTISIGYNDTTIKPGDIFRPSSKVSAVDSNGNNLYVLVYVDGVLVDGNLPLNTTKDKKYKIEYVTFDEYGNKATATRYVTVSGNKSENNNNEEIKDDVETVISGNEDTTNDDNDIIDINENDENNEDIIDTDNNQEEETNDIEETTSNNAHIFIWVGVLIILILLFILLLLLKRRNKEEEANN